MAVTGQISSQARQTTLQGLSTAMVSNALIKPASSGQTAMQAPHRMQAFQSMLKTTGACVGITVLRLSEIWIPG
jgi:hypothetical protein